MDQSSGPRTAQSSPAAPPPRQPAPALPRPPIRRRANANADSKTAPGQRAAASAPRDPSSRHGPDAVACTDVTASIECACAVDAVPQGCEGSTSRGHGPLMPAPTPPPRAFGSAGRTRTQPAASPATHPAANPPPAESSARRPMGRATRRKPPRPVRPVRPGSPGRCSRTRWSRACALHRLTARIRRSGPVGACFKCTRPAYFARRLVKQDRATLEPCRAEPMSWSATGQRSSMRRAGTMHRRSRWRGRQRAAPIMMRAIATSCARSHPERPCWTWQVSRSSWRTSWAARSTCPPPRRSSRRTTPCSTTPFPCDPQRRGPPAGHHRRGGHGYARRGRGRGRVRGTQDGPLRRWLPVARLGQVPACRLLMSATASISAEVSIFTMPTVDLICDSSR